MSPVVVGMHGCSALSGAETTLGGVLLSGVAYLTACWCSRYFTYTSRQMSLTNPVSVTALVADEVTNSLTWWWTHSRPHGRLGPP